MSDRPTSNATGPAGGTPGPEPTALDEEPGGPAPQAATRRDEWVALFPDSWAVSRRRDLFDAAFEEVAAAAELDPQAQEAARILDDRIAGGPLDEALSEITGALEQYVGADAALLVNWLCYQESTERLEQVEAVAQAPVTRFLRALVAGRGPTIDLAQRVVTSSSDDWSRIYKRAYVDALTGAQMFSIAVTKLDGSILRLECAPDSLLNLATHLLELVNAHQSMAVYSPERVELFAATLVTTTQLLTADEDGETGIGESEAAANTAALAGDGETAEA